MQSPTVLKRTGPGLCGRFALRAPAADWCQLFLPEIEPENLPAHFHEDPPRYNIAPTQTVTCIRRESSDSSRSAFKTRWGLLPSWAKELSIGNRMINARGETIDSKPSFRKAFATRRCLILMDGYYEWKKVADGKQPYLIESANNGLLAMAGLWEENSRVANTPIQTCTIITTNANQTTSGLHHRMPVFLDPSNYDQWLDPGFQDPGPLKALLKPASEDLLQMRAVSRRVNSPKHDDADCLLDDPKIK
ncbi:MAG: SOS response-associated peptidase [Rubripirellula sp.]